jgi:HEPN domain-containing protein
MVDIDKHVAHWRTGAQEDLAVARQLVSSERIRHGLFFAHLALEKAIKAHVCRHIGDLAPRIHNLLLLLEKAGLTATQERSGVLADMNAFNLQARYPDHMASPPSQSEADVLLARSEEVFRWLMSQL